MINLEYNMWDECNVISEHNVWVEHTTPENRNHFQASFTSNWSWWIMKTGEYIT
jgi:hypothetical protein